MFDVPTQIARSMKTAPGMTPRRYMPQNLAFFIGNVAGDPRRLMWYKECVFYVMRT